MQYIVTISILTDQRFLRGDFSANTFTHKVHIYSIQSTTVYVPSLELGLSHIPLSPASVPLPLVPKGGGEHTHLRVRGWGSPNSDNWTKSLALCLLCAFTESNIFCPRGGHSPGAGFRLRLRDRVPRQTGGGIPDPAPPGHCGAVPPEGPHTRHKVSACLSPLIKVSATADKISTRE